MTIDAKVCNKILANQIQQYVKKKTKHLNYMRLTLGMKNRSKILMSINETYHINRLKKNMIISIDAGKAFGRKQFSLMLKKKTIPRQL